MGYNRAGTAHKARIKRRRREVQRFVQRCAEANEIARQEGKKTTDYTSAIKEFAQFRK
jgi:hypothetical protein